MTILVLGQLCRQTVINSSVLLVSLMALQLMYVDQNTFQLVTGENWDLEFETEKMQ